MLKRIHVYQHVIRANHKSGSVEPPLSVKTSRANTRGDSVEILGPSKVVYAPAKPLSCGARVWIETQAQVRVQRNNGEELLID